MGKGKILLNHTLKLKASVSFVIILTSDVKEVGRPWGNALTRFLIEKWNVCRERLNEIRNGKKKLKEKKILKFSKVAEIGEIGKVRWTFLEHFTMWLWTSWIAKSLFSLWRIVLWMKMRMHFKAWERKMKKLINSMMIHLGQVQLVSDIFFLHHLGFFDGFRCSLYKCFVLVGVTSVTNLAKYPILGLRIV